MNRFSLLTAICLLPSIAHAAFEPPAGMPERSGPQTFQVVQDRRMAEQRLPGAAEFKERSGDFHSIQFRTGWVASVAVSREPLEMPAVEARAVCKANVKYVRALWQKEGDPDLIPKLMSVAPLTTDGAVQVVVCHSQKEAMHDYLVGRTADGRWVPFAHIDATSDHSWIIAYEPSAATFLFAEKRAVDLNGASGSDVFVDGRGLQSALSLHIANDPGLATQFPDYEALPGLYPITVQEGYGWGRMVLESRVGPKAGSRGRETKIVASILADAYSPGLVRARIPAGEAGGTLYPPHPVEKPALTLRGSWAAHPENGTTGDGPLLSFGATRPAMRLAPLAAQGEAMTVQKGTELLHRFIENMPFTPFIRDTKQNPATLKVYEALSVVLVNDEGATEADGRFALIYTDLIVQGYTYLLAARFTDGWKVVAHQFNGSALLAQFNGGSALLANPKNDNIAEFARIHLGRKIGARLRVDGIRASQGAAGQEYTVSYETYDANNKPQKASVKFRTTSPEPGFWLIKPL